MPATATCSIKSLSPISFSKHYEVDKLDKESANDYEKRTWRERCHYDKDGMVFVPPMAFKWALADAGKFLGEKIQGRRGATFTKHFESGVLVLDGLPLGVKKDEIECEQLFVPSDGKHGSGSRVTKYFPIVYKWAGVVTYHIIDSTITKDVFLRHLKESGNFIGLLRFRPRRGGVYGRFSVEDFEWQAEEA